MLTVQLKGGLGNQMFQYAFGLAQARRLKVPLQVDVTWYDEHPWRLADGSTLPSRQYGLGLWEGMVHPTARGVAPTITEERPEYDQALVDRIKDGDCLSGYWQREEYFKSIRNELVETFFPKQPLSQRALGLLEKISREAFLSTFLCVRRVDFVGTPNEILPGEYYPEACQRIIERTPGTHFFVFSDDPGWCGKNFRIPYRFTVVRGEDPPVENPALIGWHFPFAAEDMWVMSRCHNAVLANSTFSWWGAWLSPVPDGKRLVVAPSERLFPLGMPRGWERVENKERKSLHDLAVKWKSDKDPSILHGYIPYYHELLKDKKIKKMLEIGIGCPGNMAHVEGYGTVPGLNLFMWEEYFPGAEIYGLDVRPDVLVNKGRIRSFWCDQGDEKSLQAAAAKMSGEFDLIIDDGSHVPGHQVLTVKTLIPLLLKQGGIYVIEDVLDPNQVVPFIPYECEVKEFNLRASPYDRLVIIRKPFRIP